VSVNIDKLDLTRRVKVVTPEQSEFQGHSRTAYPKALKAHTFGSHGCNYSGHTRAVLVFFLKAC
jgi:hypothetical protein